MEVLHNKNRDKRDLISAYPATSLDETASPRRKQKRCTNKTHGAGERFLEDTRNTFKKDGGNERSLTSSPVDSRRCSPPPLRPMLPPKCKRLSN